MLRTHKGNNIKQFTNRWVSFSTLIVVALLLPIVIINLYAFTLDPEIIQHLKETVLAYYIINTLILIVTVGFLTAVIGIGSAYLVTFCEFRFAKFFSFVLVLPFAIPVYILGFIYFDIFNFFSPLHRFLMSIGVDGFFNVLNFNTVIIVFTLAFYPYVYLIVKSSMEKNSSLLLNPALSLGASRTKIFFKVLMPLVRPAIVASLALVLMEIISEFGTVHFYGIHTLTTAIFSAWFEMGDIGTAAYLSAIATGIVLLILIFDKWSSGKAKYRVDGSSSPIKKIKLNKSQAFFAITFLSFPFVFGFFVPAVWVIFYAIEFAEMALTEEFIWTIFNSFSAAGISTIAIMLIALFLAYSNRIYDNSYMKYLLKVSTLGYSVAAAIAAVGIMVVFTSIDHFLIDNFGLTTLLLSGTVFALYYAYMVRFLAVGLGSVNSSFEKVGIGTNRASRSLGAGLFKTLVKVDLPLIKGGIAIGFILVFVDIVKELTLTLILRPFNYNTLSSKIYELASIELIQESAMFILSMIIVCAIPMILSLKAYK